MTTWWGLVFGPTPTARVDARRWLRIQLGVIGLLGAAPLVAVGWLLVAH